MRRLLSTALVVFLTATGTSTAQVNLGAENTGVSIGNSSEWTGIRINFRDQDVERVRGINITLWQPHNPATGDYSGIMLGLPSTGGGNLTGIGIGLLGIAASSDMSGFMVGGLGVGAGNNITGLSAGLLGLGAGNDIKGISFGGLGLGAGGDIRGFAVGGFGLAAGGSIKGATAALFGMGAGEDMAGIGFAGFGMGAGGRMKGVHIAGFGMGAGGDMTGVHIAGFGVGAGGDMNGVNIAGIGLGSGGTLRGLNGAIFGIGAQEIRGLNLAATMKADVIAGISVAPAFSRISSGGELRGVSLSPYHEVKGHTHGLAIGIVNYTRTLNGVQLGLVNIVTENPNGRRMLPVLNWNFE